MSTKAVVFLADGFEESDTWLVSKLSADDYMSGISRDSLWPYALKQLGKKYSYWTTFPDNPNLN